MATIEHPLDSAPTKTTVRFVIPERPARVAGVELLGEVEDSGFADGHWLVRRGDRYLQLTELLYRVLGHSNGATTVAEIAGNVTRETEWLVEPDHVRRLLAGRLMPLGLIQTADGNVLQLPGSPSPADAPARNPSALGVNLRKRLLGPEWVERLASPLRYLFAPVFLIPMVAAAAAAHVWLYAERGLMGAFIDALYRPGSLLVLLGLIAAGGIWHELGHAAALRYGGGRARAMGVGVYLMFPIFYTDVTDSYRLGRWGRVRTGLGGIYFHLVLSLILVAAAVGLGLEFLLLGVLLLNIEMIRQLIPFGRFDGYWILADLTGVPDFYSQMPAFVRGAVGRARRGVSLPPLRRWPKVAFGAYTLATLPVLGLVAYFLFHRLPGVINVTWDAIGTQVEFLIDAVRRSDALVAATALGQLLLLGVSGLAIVYFLLLIVRLPVLASLRLRDRRWRAIGLVATLTAVVFVADAWAPRLPLIGNAAPAGVANYDVDSRAHVAPPIAYPQAPPVGGDHSATLQNCGFYDGRVPNEAAVHSLEHGAVWITFRRDVPPNDMSKLRELARTSYVLVSAFPQQSEPVVATSWGRQLKLRSALDTRLQRFVEAFRLHEDAPEAGAPCSGGRGTPE